MQGGTSGSVSGAIHRCGDGRHGPAGNIITIAGVVAIVFGAFGPCGEARAHAAETETFHVSIHFDIEPSILSRVTPEHLKDEAATLWRPYGVQLDWADTARADADRSPLEVMVERRIAGPVLPDRPVVLGQVSVGVDTADRQPILVSFDATDRTLALRWHRPFALARELSRALGRVLAHEIGHVLLGPDHDEAGLMRTGYRPNELADADRSPFRLSCAGVDRLQHRLHVLTGNRQIGWTVPGRLDGLAAIERQRLEGAPCIPDRSRRWVRS
jgi:hypothetical protein